MTTILESAVLRSPFPRFPLSLKNNKRQLFPVVLTRYFRFPPPHGVQLFKMFMMFKLFILALALILALVAAAPPNPNKPDEKEVKEEKADEYEYEDVPESRPCDARESCKDPQEDQPRPGPSQPKKDKEEVLSGNAVGYIFAVYLISLNIYMLTQCHLPD